MSEHDERTGAEPEGAEGIPEGGGHVCRCGAAECGLPGVIAELGALPPGAILYEDALARLFHRHPYSVRRAVQRGELPRPVKLFGRNAWTAGILRAHLRRRLDAAARNGERLARTISEHTA